MDFIEWLYLLISLPDVMSYDNNRFFLRFDTINFG